MTPLIGLLVFAYFLGGVPFGFLVAKAKGIDLLKVGSGNIGATNVKRALGTGWATAVFLMDMTKGLIPALIARLMFTEPVNGMDPQAIWFLAGMTAVVGHAFSPFLKFKGGKGVSTAMGAGLGAAPLVALSGFALFAVILVTVQYMAIASIVGVSSALLFGFLYPATSRQVLPLFGLVAIAVIVLHRKNLSRLFQGTEPKFSFRKT